MKPRTFATALLFGAILLIACLVGGCAVNPEWN